MPNMLEVVIVGYRNSDMKWPDTSDMNYDDVLGRRQDAVYSVNGELVVLRNRRYPVHRAYALAGEGLQIPHLGIDNRNPPSRAVMDHMIRDLTDIANDGVRLCLWEHAYHCYPYVASHLKSIFKHSVVIQADDSPGVVEMRTEPIAKYFDSAMHGNVIWNQQGEKTESLYHRLGVSDTYYTTLSISGGFEVRLSLEEKIKKIRNREYSTDVAFVGALYPGLRGRLNSPDTSQLLSAAGLRTKFYGIGMRDGPLMPRDIYKLAHPVSALYADSFAVLNLQYIGLMATRPYDAWASGSLLIQWDPVNELDYLGIKAGAHYAAFDGTMPGLIKTVRYYQSHLDETEAIIRAGHEIGKQLVKDHSTVRAIERILANHWHKWGF